MNIFRRLISKLTDIPSSVPSSKPSPIAEWYAVEWDDEKVFRNVKPPGKEPWSDNLRWNDIVRVCFEANDFTQSDGIYIFTSQRKESYLIPMEASGGQELWNELITRHLFDPELAIKAATATSGLFCWPSDNASANQAL
jgi:hypothetical protein